MRATSIPNLSIVIIMTLITLFASFAVGFSAASKPVHVNANAGELAFQENIDGGSCRNQAVKLASAVGKLAQAFSPFRDIKLTMNPSGT
ncbi:hypothetical protein ONZ45_g6024 [Pleurotus djamor]|nr:hypothetical protein ONZ45_g6024 [Pleurotus djamor]